MALPKLPPGFRFHPTDLELVTYYLRRKIHGRAMEYDIIAEVDLYKCEPWDLPDKSLIRSPDPEWFFFSARDKKYANGSRTNRATEAGYWKATGKDRAVKAGSRTLGMKKTLVFYMGRAPHGERTDWVMHEYRLEDEESGNVKPEDAFVLCRVFKKNGIGPSNLENSNTTPNAEDEVGASTLDYGPVPNERQVVSELQVAHFLSDTVMRWEAVNCPETVDHKMAVGENQSLEPSGTCNPQEASDVGMSLFYEALPNDPAQNLDTFTTMNGYSFQLEKLKDVMEVEGSTNLMTTQDAPLWLEKPLSSGEINTIAYVGNNSVDLLSFYSLEEVDMLDDLYRSTLYSQGSNHVAQYVGESSTESRFLLPNLITPKKISVKTYEGDDHTEQKLFGERQGSSPEHLTTSEDDLEEDLLEEMLQVINQSLVDGQQLDLRKASFPVEAAICGSDDSCCKVLEEPNVDQWMQSEAWNETSGGGSEVTNVAERDGFLEKLLDEPSMSPTELTALSEGQLLSSGLQTQTLHCPVEEQGRGAFPLEVPTPTAVQMDDRAKLVKPVSWFSQLLDSVCALPASAAELPLNGDEMKSEPNDLLLMMSRQNYTTSFRCSCEFVSGVWPSSAPKWFQTESSTLKSKLITSINAVTSQHTDKIYCFKNLGSGCFSPMFFVGALSAVCWLLVLRVLWLLARHMSSVLI